MNPHIIKRYQSPGHHGNHVINHNLSKRRDLMRFANDLQKEKDPSTKRLAGLDVDFGT